MRQIIEHTADVGLRVRATTLDALFAEAGEGLFELIVPNLAEAEPTQRIEIELASDSLEDLLCDWLSELLFVFETRRLVLGRFEVHVDERGPALRAAAHGEPMDQSRHLTGYEIKAVTYHQLRLEREDAGWLAEVIVDI